MECGKGMGVKEGGIKKTGIKKLWIFNKNGTIESEMC
jgi:hypothetical protein